MWITAAKFALSGVLGPAWIAKLIGIGVGVVALGATYLVWKHEIYTEGWNDHATAIANENAAVVRQNADLLRTIRACKSDSLRRWDQASSKCVRR